jgi:hypothetical protein
VKIDGRLLEGRRVSLEEELREYAGLLRFWNAPDDEHTRLQLRALVEDVIAEVLP